MLIEIDDGSGFCFGVTTAIKKAEEELAKSEFLCCLGDIVHNGQECERLKEMGFVFQQMQMLKNLSVYDNIILDNNLWGGILMDNKIGSIDNDGNMTSIALEKEFGKAKRANPLFVVPFSSARKFSAVTLDKYGTFFLGAPEFVLKKDYDLVKEHVDKYARKGYRVLLVGHNKGQLKSQDDVTKLKPEPLALILIEDTIRPDALETIEYFKKVKNKIIIFLGAGIIANDIKKMISII